MATAAFVDSRLTADAIRRIRRAYGEQPTLNLTLAQARKLLSLDLDTTEGALRTLVNDHYLRRTDQATFIRAS